jgi:hypothetical protein
MKIGPILKSSTLKPIDRRYCSCLQKVRTTQYRKNPSGYKKTKKIVRNKQSVPLGSVYNEYAVCNSSVYNSRGLKRDVMVNCSQNYDFDSLPLFSLQAFAIDKNMKLKTKGGRMLSKKQLLKNIKDKMTTEKARIERGDKRIPKNMRKNTKKK